MGPDGIDLSQLSHADLQYLRSVMGANQEFLGPLEHQVFAREWTRENPWLALPSLGAAIPAYSLAKKLGLLKTRSPASWEEILRGYQGLWQGMK